MTYMTDRNHVKPMFWGVALVVVILLCLLATRTPQSIWTGQFTTSDSIIKILPCLILFRILKAVTFITLFFIIFSLFGFSPILHIFTEIRFTLCRLTMFSLAFASKFFAFFILFIFFSADFTSAFITTFCRIVFMKFRNWLDLLATATGFGYDLFSHNQLLYSWLRLEPVSRPILVSGSFYFNTNTGIINKKRK